MQQRNYQPEVHIRAVFSIVTTIRRSYRMISYYHAALFGYAGEINNFVHLEQSPLQPRIFQQNDYA
jgi:hypothetical protein